MKKISVMVSLLFLMLGAGRVAETKEVKPTDLLVTFSQPSPLKVSPWVDGKISMLTGNLLIGLQNIGTEELFVEDLQVHNLLFRNRQTHEDYVLVHSCDCGLITKAMPAPPRRIIALKPGEKKNITIEEWDCSGGPWTPPPPGEYMVYYRIQVMGERPTPVAEKPAQKFVIGEVVEACRKQLLSTEFWKGAMISVPLELTIKNVIYP